MARNTKVFQNTAKWLESLAEKEWRPELEALGERGVTLLSAATPKDTGNTAGQWRYEIRRRSKGRWSLIFCNDHANDGANIAVLLQYGHGTGTGGYVAGVDYINPAMRELAGLLEEALLSR